ncbi:MAG: DUF58 domain-containing protein [Actinomycetia bacterium]|nr:DUF58 domain-containing protein [Actinomycetes bacterium]
MRARFLQHGVIAGLERLTGLTGQGLGLLLGAVGAVVLGHRLDSTGLTILGYVLLLLLALVWLQTRQRAAVEATRSDMPRRVVIGRTIDARLTVTARRRLSAVVLEEEFPDSLWHRVRLAVPVLPPGKPTTHAYRFRADRRGHYTVGPLRLERTDPFGFVRTRQVLAPATTFIVHPRTEPVLDRILKREFEDPIIRPPHSKPWPTGAEFYGMRPYQQGDDPRHIVWRAVARADELLVREAEHGISDTVALLVDTSLTSYPGSGESAGFERAISAAASVGRHHLESGFSVTVHSNTTEVTPRLRGKGDRIELLDALAALDRDKSSLGALVHRLLSRRSGDGHHVVITSQLTHETGAALRMFTERGRSITLVLVVDESTDPITLHHAVGLRCPVIEVLAGESLVRPFQHALTVRRR